MSFALQIFLNINFIRALKWNFLKRIYSYIDITMLCLHLMIFVNYYSLIFNTAMDYETFERDIKFLRYCQVLNALCQFGRFTYFLTLFDQLAWLLDVIKVIFIDIFYFMIIMTILGVGFSICFFIIAQNQVQFDEITDEEKANATKWPIDYATYQGSIWHVLNMVYGNTNWAYYDLGEKSQSGILYLLHCMTAFIIMIHLLNMLIAIMGNTFSERQANVDRIFYKDHLNFVLDNWYLIKTAFGGNLRDVKYIFAALTVEEDNEEQEMLENLQEDLKDQRREI